MTEGDEEEEQPQQDEEQRHCSIKVGMRDSSGQKAQSLSVLEDHSEGSNCRGLRDSND